MERSTICSHIQNLPNLAGPVRYANKPGRTLGRGREIDGTKGREIDGTTRSSLGGEREREMDGTINPVQAETRKNSNKRGKLREKRKEWKKAEKNQQSFLIFRFL